MMKLMKCPDLPVFILSSTELHGETELCKSHLATYAEALDAQGQAFFSPRYVDAAEACALFIGFCTQEIADSFLAELDALLDAAPREGAEREIALYIRCEEDSDEESPAERRLLEHLGKRAEMLRLVRYCQYAELGDELTCLLLPYLQSKYGYEPIEHALYDALSSLASFHHEQERIIQAEACYLISIELSEKLLDDDYQSHAWRHAIELSHMAQLCSESCQANKGLHYAREACALYERLHEQDASRYASALAVCLDLLGSLHMDCAQYEEARIALEQAYAITEQLDAKIWQGIYSDVAESLMLLAELSHEESSMKSTELLYRRALSLYDSLTRLDKKNMLALLASTHCRQAACYEEHEMPKKAIRSYVRASKAADKLAKLDASRHLQLRAEVHSQLATLYEASGDLDKAEASYKLACASYDSLAQQARESFLTERCALWEACAEFYKAQMRLHEAAAAWKHARELCELCVELGTEEAQEELKLALKRIASGLRWCDLTRFIIEED